LVKNIADDAITSVMSGAIVPLATEAIWTFSGLAWLEILFTQICSILGIVDQIISIVKSIGGIAGGIGGKIVGGLGSLNPFVSELTVWLAIHWLHHTLATIASSLLCLCYSHSYNNSESSRRRKKEYTVTMATLKPVQTMMNLTAMLASLRWTKCAMAAKHAGSLLPPPFLTWKAFALTQLICASSILVRFLCTQPKHSFR
jgi:hypothetical protein